MNEPTRPRMRFRKAESKDLPALTAIYNQAIEARQTADTLPLTTKDRFPWFDNHQKEQYPLIVVAIGPQIIGYGTLSPYRGGRPSLLTIAEVSYYLHEDYQRRGIGSLLLQYLMNTAAKLGYKHLFALLLDTNHASIALLDKFDFTPWGHFPNVAEIDGKTCGQLYYGKALSGL